MPLTTTGSPMPMPASRTAWTAVIPLQASTAAASNVTVSGRGTRFLSGTITYSAKPPSAVNPIMPRERVHSRSRLVLQ